MWIDILIGVAASTAFFLIEQYLLDWQPPWDIVSSVSVFIVAAALAFFLRKKNDEEAKRAADIMSGNKVGKDMNARIHDGTTTQPPSNVLSSNKVGGNADFEIKNTKL